LQSWAESHIPIRLIGTYQALSRATHCFSVRLAK
jgi:hypothetical protein